MNTLYLTCKHHPSQVESCVLATRGSNVSYTANSIRQLQKFLDKHAHCGGGFDHFTVGYASKQDVDLPIPAPVADAVHLAIVANQDHA